METTKAQEIKNEIKRLTVACECKYEQGLPALQESRQLDELEEQLMSELGFGTSAR